jgi:O-antigen/teichoic acid export membrane protein
VRLRRREPPAGGGRPRGSGLFTGSAINFVGLAVGSAAQFGVVVVLTQSLSQRQAGIFLIAFAAFRIAVGLFGLGVNVTAVRYVALSRGRGDAQSAACAARTVLGLALAGGLVGALALGGASGLFAVRFHSASLGPITAILAAGIPLSTVTLTAAGIARGTRRTTTATFLEQGADAGFRFVGLAVGLVVAGTPTAAAWGFTIGGGFAAAAAFGLTWQDWRGASLLTGGELRHLLRFSGYQWGTVFTGTAFRWADSLLLGLWKSPADVAVYSSATRAIWLGLVFVMPIALAFQPIIAELAEARAFDELRQLYVSATRLSTTVGCTPLLLTGVAAAPLLEALYGPSYKSGATSLAFLAVGQSINAATGPAATVVTMIGRADLTLIFNAAALVADVALNAILIPAFGMSGAGAAWCLSLGLLCALRFLQCRREIHVRVFDRWFSRAILSLAVGLLMSEVVLQMVGTGEPALTCVIVFCSGAVAISASMLALGLRLGDIVRRPSPGGTGG